MSDACKLSCKLCHVPDAKIEDYANETLVLDTTYGQIDINPYYKLAPNVVALVLQMAHRGACLACKFYRNEVPPKEGDGPPYALLQGSLSGLTQVPPREGNIEMKRGMVAMIPGTAEFFIAVAGHPEWGTSHTVWGEVLGWDTIDKVLALPFHVFKHPEFGTEMRMLNMEVPFTLKVKSAGAPGATVVTAI